MIYELVLKNENGTITPVSGKNDIFAEEGSGITRVEIDIEEAPPQEPFLSVEGLSGEYIIENTESITVNITVIAEPNNNLLIEIYNSDDEAVTVVNSDSSVSEHALTINQPTEGTYSLIVKLLSGSEFITQITETFDLVLPEPPSEEYDYVYPDSISFYTAGTRVLATDGNIYECKPWPYTGWCSGAKTYYAPGTGLAWSQAWTLIGASGQVLPDPVAEYDYPEGIGSYDHGTLVLSENGSIYRCLGSHLV